MRTLLLLTLTIVCTGLTGCYEDPANVTLHETQGDSRYAGSPVNMADTSEHHEELAKRFQMVQTDR